MAGFTGSALRPKASPENIIQRHPLNDISNGVTTIGHQAFYHDPMPSVTLPGSVANIGVDAFELCTLLGTPPFTPAAPDSA
jgi:hypothetical protein